MLTKQDLVAFGGVINWGYKWGSCPFYFDCKDGILRPATRIKRLQLLCGVIFWWWYTAYLAYVVYKGKYTQGTSNMQCPNAILAYSTCFWDALYNRCFGMNSANMNIYLLRCEGRVSRRPVLPPLHRLLSRPTRRYYDTGLVSWWWTVYCKRSCRNKNMLSS